jgi:hypothetical protein
MKRVVGLLFVAACKVSAASSEGGAAPAETVLAAQLPSPVSKAADFKVDDDVAVVEDDGTFDIEARVYEVSAKLANVKPPAGNGAGARLAQAGWQPTADGTTKGYRVLIGATKPKNQWIPATQAFPPPWMDPTKTRVGDTFSVRRFGNFESPKCSVTEVPTNPRVDVNVKCSDSTTRVARHDMVANWRTPTLAELTEGEIVYFDKSYWAMVVGKQGNQVVIRQAGWASKDTAVDLSRVQTTK